MDLEEKIQKRLELLKANREQLVQQLIAHNAVIAELEAMLKSPEQKPDGMGEPG
jgi:hypothetical protein